MHHKALAALSAFAILGAPMLAEGAEYVIGGKTAGQVFADPRVAALARGACDGNLGAVQQALSQGANPNTTGYSGVTPLFWAERCESLPGMEALLRAGADPNYRFPGVGGFSAVAAAATMRNPAFLRLLLRYGGDPNTVVEGGHSALQYAMRFAMGGHGWDNYYTLLDGGADIQSSYAGYTIAEFAAGSGQYEKVIELLDRGYNHDLDELYGMAAVSYQSPGSDQAMARDRLLRVLESRGVHPRSRG